VANGVLFSESAYFKDGYNRLDFFVLVVSVLDLLLSASATGAGRALRVLRALRPLRVLSRNEGMRMIVESIIRSMPAIFYVVVLSGVWIYLFQTSSHLLQFLHPRIGTFLISFIACLLHLNCMSVVFIFLIFSIIGVGLFSGKFYSCNDSNASGKSDCEGLVQDEYGVWAPQIWENPTYSFDNTLYGLLTLFEVSTLEGWLDVMHSAMDTTEVDKQPQKDNNWTSALYFVIFIIVASFFILQLFIGVFTDNFNRFRGTALLTEGQRAWVDLQRMMLHMKPLKFLRIPKDTFSKKVFKIVQHKAFEYFILICIVINVFLMMTEHYGQSDDWTFFLGMIPMCEFLDGSCFQSIAHRLCYVFSLDWLHVDCSL
jgi:voltage-gated cation channel